MRIDVADGSVAVFGNYFYGNNVFQILFFINPYGLKSGISYSLLLECCPLEVLQRLAAGHYVDRLSFFCTVQAV
ncbi:MAG: hypothetical protein ACTTJ7_05590 [Treponema sp.]